MASKSFIHCCFRSFFFHFQVAHTTKSILKVNTTNIFLRSNTLRPKTFSGLTPARQKLFSRVAHMTNSFSGRRHPNISSGRTYDQNLSHVKHATKHHSWVEHSRNNSSAQVEQTPKILSWGRTQHQIILLPKHANQLKEKMGDRKLQFIQKTENFGKRK